MGSDLTSFARRDADATVLVVTNLWPREDRPTHGVFVRRQTESVLARGIRADVLVIHGDRSPLAYLQAALQLLWWSMRGEPRYRLVHAHGGETALAARFYLRAPLLVSFLGSDILGVYSAEAGIGPKARLRALLMRSVSLLVAGTITKSGAMAATLPRRARLRNTVLPNGVDRRLFRPMPRTHARAMLEWNDAERVVLFIANPRIPNKRFALARAATEVAQRLVGPIRLQVAHGVDPAQIPVMMAAADCLVQTSVTEGSPNVVKEALACDLAVISTGAGDTPELLAGVRGCAVCEPTPDAVGAAIARCVGEPMRSNGRERTEWLDEGTIAGRLIELYRRLGRF
jgi:teichuronic acid biosynthesis glycosyltransferase TuaC